MQHETIPLLDEAENIIYYMQPGSLTYFLTITLKPHLYKFNSLTQYEMTVNYVKAILKHASSYYCSTELTVQANVHYHSIVQFSNKVQMMRVINMLKRNKYFGFIHLNSRCIESLDQLKRSANYMCKELSDTTKVMHTSNYKPLIVFNS